MDISACSVRSAAGFLVTGKQEVLRRGVFAVAVTLLAPPQKACDKLVTSITHGLVLQGAHAVTHEHTKHSRGTVHTKQVQHFAYG